MPSRTSSKSEATLIQPSSRASLRRIVAPAKGLALPIILALCVLNTLGCAHLNNPWRDSSSVIDHDLTTPSAEGHKGKTEFGRPHRRAWAPSEFTMVNGAVTHWPLWFEDPFETKGNGYLPVDDRDAPDNEFAINWVDYFHIAYGPARLCAVNIPAFPVSAVIFPPGTLMESDGRISKQLLTYDYDPIRADSVTREPPDYNDINMTKAAYADETGG